MRALFALAALASLFAVGCSKDKDVEPPAALLNFSAKLDVAKIWSAGIGSGKQQARLRLGLGPCIDNGIVFAASHKGAVLAIDLKTGQRRWRDELKLPLSAGPSAAFGMVVVGTSKGLLIALDAASGRALWRTQLSGELLSAAAISESLVAVRSVDGKLHGLNAATGKEKWSVEQAVPRLSLRGTAIPVIFKDTVISGFDDGKIMALNLNTGDTLWDVALASPHGKTELERLVDIDSAVSVAGDNVYAIGFQGRVAMLALDSGQIWWAHDMSSDRGLTVDNDTLYVATADGLVIALRGRDGSEVWRNDKLKRRGLSKPAVTGTAVAVADFQGYLHWLDKATGELLARQRVGKYRVTNPPAYTEDSVVVLTDDGQLSAFRAVARKKP